MLHPGWDREVYDGFYHAAEQSTYGNLIVGIYASYDYWNSATFGCGSCASGYGYIPYTYEWTYGNQTTVAPSASNEPAGWCISTSPCAVFFGGQDQSSSHAVMWQWAANSTNGGDFDQIDDDRLGAG